MTTDVCYLASFAGSSSAADDVTRFDGKSSMTSPRNPLSPKSQQQRSPVQRIHKVFILKETENFDLNIRRHMQWGVAMGHYTGTVRFKGVPGGGQRASELYVINSVRTQITTRLNI